MRKLIPLFFLIASMAMAAGEKTQFTTVTDPDSLYFVTITNVVGGSLTITNTYDKMWYLGKVVTFFTTASTSTNSLNLVWKHTDKTYTDSGVVTNEFGAVQTNNLWGVGADTNTFLTNSIASWTNAASTRASVTPENDYIQRGDILQFTFSNTNALWLRITGRR